MIVRILVVAPAIPKPDWNSGDRRFLAMLRLLAKYYKVDLWTVSEDYDLSVEEQERYQYQLSEIDVKYLPNQKGLEEPLAKAFYDVILFEFYWLAERFISISKKCQPQLKIIVDSVDLHFAREAMAADLGLIELEQVEKTRLAEVSTYAQSDAVIVVSGSDQTLLLKQNEHLKTFIVPNIVSPELQVQQINTKELIFVGGYNWFPNVDGIVWFVENIWPSVKARVQDATLSIIGSHPTSEVNELNKFPGVKVLGYVPDTAPCLKQAAISIAPLRYGGGMKGKVNEAMAFGLPVVTTSVGAQGLNAVSGQHLLIADSPNEFAEAIVQLLDNPTYRSEIGLAGQRHNATLCAPEVAESALQTIIAFLFPKYQPNALSFAWLRHSVAFHSVDFLRSTYLWRFARTLRDKLKRL